MVVNRSSNVAAAAIAVVSACACGCGSSNDAAPDDAQGLAGEKGSGGVNTGGARATGGGGGPSTGGSLGSGGTSSANPNRVCAPAEGGASQWTDISTAQIGKLGGASAQSYPGGCSGTVVNRLTGDVSVHIVGFGIWRSSDEGSSWVRIDGNVIDAGGGRCENGWSLQVDQDDPTRMAVFTLDGSAGYTVDGTTWTQWAHAPWGRNWDYGSVDWSSASAKTILGVEHEKPSSVVTLSTDGGTTWAELTTFDVVGGSAAMVGVIDSTTLIGSKGTGILRSTDLGATWNVVSSVNPLSHVPVRFKSKFYLTTSAGLLVSADQGATWKPQGVAIPKAVMFQGPYFGADESTMVVGTNSSTDYGSGTSSIHKTTDGGAHWVNVGDAPGSGAQFPFNYVWFGGFSWDPIHDAYFTTAMSHPAYRADCGG
jgi:hypothetical protein